MSDVSGGEGWWRASDGKWYSPDLKPPPPLPLSGTDVDPGPQSSLTPTRLSETSSGADVLCSNGHSVKDGAVFCDKCGVSMSNQEAPGSVDHAAPGSTTGFLGSVAVASDIPVPGATERPTKVRMNRNKWLMVGGGVVVLVIAVVIGVILGQNSKKPTTAASATSSGNSGNSGSGNSGNSGNSDAAVTAAASAAYIKAYNTMLPALNAGISNQNSSDSSTQTAGINAEIAAYQTFSSAINSITFPTSAQTDAQHVLSAEASLVTVLGTLSVNTGNTGNYNQVFDTVTPALTAFTSACTALQNDIGVQTSGSGSSGNS